MTEKIIVKREPKRNGGNLILFFPETYTRENRYQLQYWTPEVEHGYSLDKEYYKICKPVDYKSTEVIEFVARYVRYMRSLPDMGDYTVTVVKKITRK